MGLLRSMFGPSRDEVWRQLAAQTGARVVDGGMWKGSKVVAKVGEWTVTLDVYVVPAGHAHIPMTRIRAPYVNPDGFRFQISRKNVFSGLGRLLGMQDIEIGDTEFDDAFVIKGTDEAKVRALFADPKLRRLVAAQPALSLAVKDDEGWFGGEFPEGVDELIFETSGEIKDVERLKGLFDVFGATLHRLTAIGSAYEGSPDVELR